MKYFMLVCEGLSDEPMEELGGRTPLEVAKTPHMDQLARSGKVGSALFTPHSLAPSADVASMSILGYNPEEFYTGIAPLEAFLMGFLQNDQDLVFRCDLVTVLDEYLIDTSASRITPKESNLLLEELSKGLLSAQFKFYSGGGYKNILVVKDPELIEDLDEVECADPRTVIGQKFVKHLPRGKKAQVLTDLMDRSKEALENHEINRVRIDLNENPANMIWPWGQGKKPKLPAFKDRYGMTGAVVSSVNFSKGLGKLVGFRLTEIIEACSGESDFIFCYAGCDEDVYARGDFKAKIKFIEEFDSAVVGKVVKWREAEHQSAKICVSSDHAASIAKKGYFHGNVPFLIEGEGVSGEGCQAFNEKVSTQSKLIFDQGHKLMEYFLKK